MNIGILQYTSLFIRPQHDYLVVLLQFSFLYIVYSLFVVTFKKYAKYSAYKHITKEKIIESVEVKQVQPQKQQTEKDINKNRKDNKTTNERKESAQIEKMEEMKTKDLKDQQKDALSYKELLKQEKHNKLQQNKEKQKYISKITHPLFLSQVKGFADIITDFSYNNKYLIVSSFDSSIKLFEMSEFFKKIDQPKFLFHNLTDMHATAICISKKEDMAYFSANNQLFLLELYPKAEDKQYFKVIPKTKNCHKSDITSLHVDDNDKILISTSADTHIKVWNMKGELLKEINTSYGEHYGSFYFKNMLVVSSWSVDTSIYELKFNKDNTFRTLEKEEVLRGEKTSIIDATLNETGTLATICNKAQARLLKLNTERKIKDDARLLFKVEKLNIQAAAASTSVFIVAANGNLHIYNMKYEEIDVIEGAANGLQIKKIRIHQLHSNLQNKNYYVCFVQGENVEKLNLFDLTQYHE